MATNDDGAGDRHFKVQAELTRNQTYYVEVKGNGAATGTYTVSTTYIPILTLSPTSWVMPTASGGVLPVTVTTNTGGFAISFSDTGMGQGGSEWPAENTIVSKVNLGANQSTSPRTTTVTFSTHYEPKVTRTLTVTQPGRVTGDECGSSTSSNCAWTGLGSFGGAIQTNGDKDWFKFTPIKSGAWVFESFASATSQPLRDSVGTIYQSNGTTVVATDDNSAGSGQFKVRATLTAGQTYFLEVKGSGTNTGDYGITATAP